MIVQRQQEQQQQQQQHQTRRKTRREARKNNVLTSSHVDGVLVLMKVDGIFRERSSALCSV